MEFRWGLVLISLLSFCFAIPTGQQNITVSVAEGTVYSQATDELCRPASWTDIVTFIFTNYVAHAATIRPRAGAETMSKVYLGIISLLLPAWGMSRAISSIQSFATFGRNPLEKATRAGALVMIQRSIGWRPMPGDTIHHASWWSAEGSEPPAYDASQPLTLWLFTNCEPWIYFEWRWPDWVNSGSQFAFELELPKGYGYVRVPRNALVERRDADFDYADIKSSYSVASIMIAIVQLVFACTTLYEARARQLSQYGYAAFGLTVAPYVVMSFLNLLGALFCPDYEELYLVRSEILDEALRRCETKPRNVPVAGDLVEIDYELDPFLDMEVLRRRGKEVAVCLAKFSQGDDDNVLATTFQVERCADGRPREKQESTTPMTWRAMHEEECDPTIEKKRLNRLLYPSTNPFKLTTHPARRFLGWLLRSPPGQNSEPEPGWDERSIRYTTNDRLGFIFAILMYGAIVAIVGGISHFRPSQSTVAQRVWTMGWLAAGLSTALIYELTGYLFEDTMLAIWLRSFPGFSRPMRKGLVMLSSSFAIGGIVVVGQMLRSYGNCVLLS